MDEVDLEAPRGTKISVALLVALLHFVVILALIRAFAPDLTNRVTEQVIAAFTVTVTAPEPKPTPPPQARENQGAAADVGRKAQPKPVAAPRPKIEIAQIVAPAVASQGNDLTSGARDAGAGTGAGGQGNGAGGGTAEKAVKIAGDINSAKDYPEESRDLRVGDYVIVVLAVGADGRVSACRVHRASRDAQADAITCRLATQRFRFRPARDAGGNPVASTFGWQQRWFYPGGKSE